MAKARSHGGPGARGDGGLRVTGPGELFFGHGSTPLNATAIAWPTAAVRQPMRNLNRPLRDRSCGPSDFTARGSLGRD
jgi:hypothetical protein